MSLFAVLCVLGGLCVLGAVPRRLVPPRDRPRRFYLIMNLAVGGNFLGSPDGTTRFPGVMEIDFVRVFSRRISSRRPVPRGAGPLPAARK